MARTFKINTVATTQYSKWANFSSHDGSGEPIGIMIHHWGLDGQDHDVVARYLAKPKSDRQSSAHDVISAGRVTRVVPWEYAAWHGQGEANGKYLGFECRPEMSPGDWATLVERCVEAEEAYNKSLRYVKHNDYVATSCPGRYSGRLGELIDAVNAEHKRRGNTMLAGGGSGSSAPRPKTKTKIKPTSNKSVADMAAAVIAGKHGNGHAARQRSLGVTNAVYADVRSEVNRLAQGGAAATRARSISDMATEVIQGRHGNGHAARQRSLGVSNDTYKRVRALVNKRLG